MTPHKCVFPETVEVRVNGGEKEIEKDGKRKHLRPTRELELFPSDVEAKGDKKGETAK